MWGNAVNDSKTSGSACKKLCFACIILTKDVITMDENTIIAQAEAAKRAALEMMALETSVKNSALNAMADALINHSSEIIAANQKDVEAAKLANRPQAMIDRLELNEARIQGMAAGLRKVADLPDPVGGADAVYKRPNGLHIEKRRVPLGVVGIIYEARPNVTADAIGLCIKSGNACLLRGGSEAINSNVAVADIMAKAAYDAGLPFGAIQLVRDVSRESSVTMMKLNGLLDVLIPRGGASLIQTVIKNATVPVIETGVGNCHVYVDDSADLNMAANIVYNAKCSRPAVCNAAESLLVHKAVAPKLAYITMPLKQKQVELRACQLAIKFLPDAVPAKESDWEEEYLDYIMSVRVVDSVQEAIDHINKYGTKHSETIITESYKNAEMFLNNVDAAAVYVNASTRFTDGEEFGFGAEIGISTQKLHARGPMGLEALTTIKYVVRGSGQSR